ncbi:COQ9 family protein [Magnetospirillum sulfuroxidans]|uniref:COQ9 family protein n=1 Tax=Magnetospirillum sulfuroxidans TaxID=611300 RepID=A0ABS5IBB5_9PROT|nr:COQ9 family protein [Magnetospirillum sulfuroxidans]MBR9971714.1 COQ9 family protein [Magnetospirillum sulfuroxidans]
MDFQDIRDRLIVAALPHAVFDGWTAKTLVLAATDLEMELSLAERAFMGGPVEAVEHFADFGDRLMVADCGDLATLKTPDRIKMLIRTRLERWSPHREALRRALALLALPSNAPIAAKITGRTVDAMWRAAGDVSHDFSWYTKRATLAGVYTATLLYWLDDGSPDCADSWAFLDRRLADVGRITKARKGVGKWLATVLPKPAASKRV